jgi:hypothetical protein
MKNNSLIAFVLIFWLVGCNSVPSTAVTPLLPTATASITVTPTKIVGTPTATSTPTPDFYLTEFWVTTTAVVEAIVGTQQPRRFDSYLSPEGQWLAEVLIYDCIKIFPQPDADDNAYEQLRLVERSSGEIKVADGQLLGCGGLGAAGLEGLFWSQNSRYFYYTDAREGVPDGCGYWQRPIRRLDINTWSITDLGSGFLSPDGTRIAAWDEKELVIWDVNEGEEAGRISPTILNAETGNGPVVWSPDSQAFVYIQPESFCPVSGNSIVVHVDTSTLEQKLLLESASPTFGGASWNRNNVLILVDENGDQWVYTFDEQKLEPSP